MIPLVMANEQGSVQAFNPFLFGTGVVVYPAFTCIVFATKFSLRYSVTEGFNPVCCEKCMHLVA